MKFELHKNHNLTGKNQQRYNYYCFYIGLGDIYPTHTVQFEEKVNVISLNPELGDPKQKQLLALGMENGRVEVHHLKADYRASDSKACNKELERFLHYVSII